MLKICHYFPLLYSQPWPLQSPQPLLSAPSPSSLWIGTTLSSSSSDSPMPSNPRVSSLTLMVLLHAHNLLQLLLVPLELPELSPQPQWVPINPAVEKYEEALVEWKKDKPLALNLLTQYIPDLTVICTSTLCWIFLYMLVSDPKQKTNKFHLASAWQAPCKWVKKDQKKPKKWSIYINPNSKIPMSNNAHHNPQISTHLLKHCIAHVQCTPWIQYIHHKNKFSSSWPCITPFVPQTYLLSCFGFN